jgi:ABC-2 type transport system permease protein
MSPSRTLAITARLLAQFRHDHRTLGILFVTPIIVLGIFALLLGTDAPEPRVGVVLDGSGALAVATEQVLVGSDAINAASIRSAEEAEQLLRDARLDAYIVIPSEPDDTNTFRPQIVIEGTDPQMKAIVAAALQGAFFPAIDQLTDTLPTRLMGASLDVEVHSLYGGDDLDTLDLFGGPFIGLLIFFLVYVVTSVSFLRERSLGTLERLMASPLRRTEIVVGYMLGFTLVALVQAAIILGFGLGIIGLYNVGSVALLFGIEVLLALVAVNLGIFLSTFARTEFQAVQFIPLVIVPQLLLSGLLVPVSSEPEWLQWISNVLPLTYAVDALRDVMLRGADLASSSVQLDIAVLGGFCVLVVLAAAATLRREVA